MDWRATTKTIKNRQEMPNFPEFGFVSSNNARNVNPDLTTNGSVITGPANSQQTPNLLEPEFSDLYNAWKANPGPTTNSAILKAAQPIIEAAIKSYGAGDRSPLLIGRARRMVLEALPIYDPTKGPLKIHLANRLRGLQRAFVQQNQIISIPEQVRLDQHHLFKAENELRDSLGRDPTDEELADYTGLSMKRLAYIRKAQEGMPEGVMERVTDEGDDLYDPAVADSDDDSWKLFVYSSLSPQDRLIMEYTLGMNNKKKLSAVEIARKLGVTPAAISQRKSRIQKMLNERQSLGVL